MKKLSNQPGKGMTDWFPEEFSKKKFIFDNYRKICKQFGYEEYLTPLLESAEIYRAKSGEDVGGKELWLLKDKADREYAVRPEMTPSVTRLVSRIYDQVPKPLRLFSIANFMRNEKPQRGRSREFWQLNYDLFGADSLEADIEILQIALEIMLGFNPPEGSFTLYINNRKLIELILNEVAQINEDQKVQVVRILDKWEKLTLDDFNARLFDIGLSKDQISDLIKFMTSTDENVLASNLPQIKEAPAFQETLQIISTLRELGYTKWLKFQPNVIRGFDYYDGVIFEVFDNNQENSRSIFGGGRYNGLAGIFGDTSFPSVGAAPGDVTMDLFLSAWNLYPQNLMKLDGKTRIYFPIINDNSFSNVRKVIQNLRKANDSLIIEMGLKIETIYKALDYANKKQFDYVYIFGEEEQKLNIYKAKNMQTGLEETIGISW